MASAVRQVHCGCGKRREGVVVYAISSEASTLCECGCVNRREGVVVYDISSEASTLYGGAGGSVWLQL